MRGVVLIGASTGAPRIHDKYLAAMPQDFGLPIVIIQHMPPGAFIEGLLRYIAAVVDVPVSMASDGQPLQPQQVLLVEPGHHLRFDPDGTKMRIRRQSGENFFSPSMDIAFGSAAEVFGRGTYVAMTSGLHAEHDGLRGCRMVRAAGGKVLVTDEATTPCPLMGAEIRRANAYDKVVPMSRVLQTVDKWAREEGIGGNRHEACARSR